MKRDVICLPHTRGRCGQNSGGSCLLLIRLNTFSPFRKQPEFGAGRVQLTIFTTPAWAAAVFVQLKWMANISTASAAQTSSPSTTQQSPPDTIFHFTGRSSVFESTRQCRDSRHLFSFLRSSSSSRRSCSFFLLITPFFPHPKTESSAALLVVYVGEEEEEALPGFPVCLMNVPPP